MTSSEKTNLEPQCLKLTDSSPGLKCKTFCKMCRCENSAKNLQFCRFFCNNFLKNFCKFWPIFLQIFCKFFANWFGIRTKGTHFQVNILFSRRGCWMINSWPLFLFYFLKCAKNLQKKFAKKLKQIAKKLQKNCKKLQKIAKILQNAQKRIFFAGPNHL